MLEGYRNFHASQKSLYTVMYPESIFSPSVAQPYDAQNFRLVKHSEYVKMERGCLSLMFSMLNQWFRPFDQLKHEVKIQILRAFSGRFTHLDQCFRTAQAFPPGSGDGTRRELMVMHYG